MPLSSADPTIGAGANGVSPRRSGDGTTGASAQATTPAAAAAQACGRQAAGYGTVGPSGSTAYNSGNRGPNVSVAPTRPPSRVEACSVKPASTIPRAQIAVSCGHTEPLW